MSEEVKIKISQPMFESGELERFDNNIHNIIEEYSKLMFKEKDQILTQRIIMKQEQEIERLNNIIKDIKSQLDYLETYSSKEDVFEDMKRRLDRIDKIIGSDKE